MQILALSDQVVSFIYSPIVKKRFPDISLVVGCGDLPADYLEYVLSVLDAPLVYVPGNHDLDRLEVPGGSAVDGRFRIIKGITVLGLGGSKRYKAKGKHQHTESEMRFRVLGKIISALWHPRIRRQGLDLFISHAPPRGIHDAEDFAHQGFRSFHLLLRWLRPKMMLHGHTHAPPNLAVSETMVGATRVINAYPYRQVAFDR